MPSADNVIAFNNTVNGGISVILAADSSQFTMLELGYRLVPAGKKFVIVPRADIPADNELWFAMEIDESSADGTGMTDEEWEDYLASKPQE